MNDTSSVENNSTINDNSNNLLNLIQSIQSKLNVENNNNNELNKEVNETVKNEISEEKSNTNNNTNNNSKNNLSNLLQNLDISSIINSLGGNNNQNKKDDEGFKIDPNTIYRIQNILSSMNKEDPKKNLLISLKPFLRKSRQDKISEYITLLTVANAVGIFNRKGSDKNE